jgi:hypothetical protein
MAEKFMPEDNGVPDMQSLLQNAQPFWLRTLCADG